MKRLDSSGFSHVAIILLLVVVAGIAGAGWYVVQSQGEESKTLKVADSYLASLKNGDKQQYEIAMGGSDRILPYELGYYSLMYNYFILKEPVLKDNKVAEKDGKKIGLAVYDAVVDDATDEGIEINIQVYMKKSEAGWYVESINISPSGSIKASTDPLTYEDEGGYKNYGGLYTLSTIGAVYGERTEEQKDNRRRSDIDYLMKQFALYFKDNGNYPARSELEGITGYANLNTVQDPEYTGMNPAIYEEASGSKTYSYTVSSEDGSSCDNVEVMCVKLIMTATLSTGEVISKSSN